jgi:predicted nuclease of predicted toxin-antitoxin system
LPEGDSPSVLRVLLDQNIPREMVALLQQLRPGWQVLHTSDVSLQGESDFAIFEWAQSYGYVIVTFDADFSDRRGLAAGQHQGIIRLRVWPTTVEEAGKALERLLESVNDQELAGALVIVGQHHIRVRTSRPDRPES